MKRMGFLSAALVAALACGLVFSACSKPADDQIQAAEDMIKRAEGAGATTSSPNLFGKAKDALAEAKRLNEAGSYTEARKKAEDALIRAEQAAKNAEKLGGRPSHKRGDAGGDAE